MDHLVEELLTAKHEGRLERRDFIKWASLLGLSVPLLELPRAHAAEMKTRIARPTAVKRGGTLRLGVGSPASIEPTLLSDAPGIAVVQACCEYVVKIDQNLIVRPQLATSWSPSEGGKTWTFKLRRGVKFHNGKEMTADDVVATFKRLVDPKNTSSSSFPSLTKEGVRKVDQYTIAFHLSRPLVDFPYFLNAYQAVILPASYQGNFAKNAIGTGPFKLVEYVPQQRARYVKNPHYWQPGLPYLEGVDIILGLSPDAEAAQLQGGSVDMLVLTQASTIPALRANSDVQIKTTRTSGYYALFMRCDKAPFNDKRVRQAVALCINRPNVIKSVIQGLGVVANDHVISPVFPLYSPIPQREQNYAKAKSLLAAAGHGGGLNVTVTTASDYPDLAPLGEIMQAMTKPAGISLKLNTEPATKYYGSGNDWLDAAVSITNWTHRPTPSQLLNIAYRSTGIWNASHWHNGQMDSLTSQLDATLDPTKRKAIVRRIEVIMNDEVPAVIPYFTLAPRALRKNVQGLNADPSTFIDLSTASLG